MPLPCVVGITHRCSKGWKGSPEGALLLLLAAYAWQRCSCYVPLGWLCRCIVQRGSGNADRLLLIHLAGSRCKFRFWGNDALGLWQIAFVAIVTSVLAAFLRRYLPSSSCLFDSLWNMLCRLVGCAEGRHWGKADRAALIIAADLDLIVMQRSFAGKIVDCLRIICFLSRWLQGSNKPKTIWPDSNLPQSFELACIVGILC